MHTIAAEQAWKALLVLFLTCEGGEILEQAAQEAEAAPSLEVFKSRLDGVGVT